MSAPPKSMGAADARAWSIAERITGPCTCIDAYKGRGLTAPDCAWHSFAEEITTVILSEQAEFHAFQKTAIAEHDRLCAWNDRLAAKVARLREALTPSADTKAAYLGEFTFPLSWHPHSVCVPWTTIQEIMAAILARAARRSGQHATQLEMDAMVRRVGALRDDMQTIRRAINSVLPRIEDDVLMRHLIACVVRIDRALTEEEQP